LFLAAPERSAAAAEHVVARLRAGGAEIDPADLAHVWPLQHARIIPNGTYFLGWPQSQTPEMASA